MYGGRKLTVSFCSFPDSLLSGFPPPVLSERSGGWFRAAKWGKDQKCQYVSAQSVPVLGYNDARCKASYPTWRRKTISLLSLPKKIPRVSFEHYMPSHIREKPFVCSSCLRRFRYKANLIRVRSVLLEPDDHQEKTRLSLRMFGIS